MKLNSIPDSGTVIALRGDIDFYFWKGLPVGRRWPRKSTVPRTVREIRSSQAFSAAAIMTGALAPVIQQGYKTSLPPSVGVTWVDMFRATARGKGWIAIR